MRRYAIVAVMAAVMMLFGAGSALAGVAGTSEPRTAPDPVTGETEPTNQVSCGTGTAQAGPVVVATAGDPATGGAIVVCNESADLPIQGRVIGSGGTSGGWVAADGDADNTQNEKAQGWARADVNGDGVQVRCGDPNGDLDSENPGATDTQEQCDPTAG
ncbi:MAG: hypothetical protein QOG87_3948 [Actinomycetota bacterium]|jgi:hypothetical protein